VAMDDQQDLQEGWQAHDLRSGVAKVYDEAKRRSTFGIRVASSWAIVILLYGILGFTGAVNVAPTTLWDLAAGFGAIVLAALSVSRAPAPLLTAALLVLADVSVVSYNLPEMLDHGSAVDHVAAGIRIALAPATMLIVLNGYFGSLSIQAFKNGFSPGADWRTRISPRMLQLVVIGACGLALTLGVGTWVGAIMSGFAETDVVWFTKHLMMKPIDLTVGKTKVKEAKTDGKKPDAFSTLNVLEHGEKPPFKYPESAVPIDNVQGLDEFTRDNVLEAYEFAEDSNDTGCVLEGHGRQDRCRDDRCRYWARVFARACLTRAKKTEHFCDSVPDVTAEDDSMKWGERMCAGRNPEYCREMLYTQQGHCHPPSQDIVRTFFPNTHK
jgi:hypothetical protein